jgi:magnesium-protoporphyrin O-methyltransferase
MATATLEKRRSELETYFDRTAVDAWARLTSDAPVSRVRATVRAGRDRMRETLLDMLPRDLRGCRILDAGCGTGALAVEAARRGAKVVAIDLSHKLVQLAQERIPSDIQRGQIEFRVGDMFMPDLGRFNHVVAMDSLIHYRCEDVVSALCGLAARTEQSVVFTFAPGTPLLATMRALGKLFPRGDRAPALEPVSEQRLRRQILAASGLAGWQVGNTVRISSGFYKSQAMELLRA